MEDDHQTRFIIVMTILVSIPIVIGIWLTQRKNRALKILWDEYQEALRSVDKSRALVAGRKYYSRRRGGILSIYDEQAIANDMSTMK